MEGGSPGELKDDFGDLLSFTCRYSHELEYEATMNHL
jgi:hypothetical protein